ncbi:uncharacterized protein LOC130726582 [Lotus japonicus]|uniref:uncharacterized protein LOC130726582 n=1 Tax=Lotus japonicus TaxID=34305 RepID=UPI0025831213|nr:uncharacterized protein LOC130726582 [Lotus japonicus]
MSSSSIFVRRSSSLSTRQKSPFALGFLPQVILRNKVTFREGDLDFSTALDLIQYRSWIWLKAKVKGPFFSLLNGSNRKQKAPLFFALLGSGLLVVLSFCSV